MILRHHVPSDSSAITQLFSRVFSESEGEAEGKLIGQLASNLFESSKEADLYNVVADIDDHLVASIFLTRVEVDSPDDVFMLAPVAVHSDFQGKGIGQALINYGLSELRNRDVRFVLTYGDPAFYGKVGFRQVSEDAITPPFKLSQPEGWLGLSLVGDGLETLSGNCSCVEAFCDPVYW